MSLSVALRHSFRDFALDVSFETTGGITALFGVSGAGKTTVVNAVAGLLRPNWGRISIGGTTYLDTDRNIDLPTHARRLGYVFQEGRLFPHMTVRQNLGYARRMGRGPTDPEASDQVIALLGIEDLLARRPARLSGGEKQRVAIARALLSDPDLLLLDEPLAALDMARKDEVLPYLARLRDETDLPILYISHARAEVRQLATQVVVLTRGRVTAQGSVGEVLGRGGAGRSADLDISRTAQLPGGLFQLETPAGPLTTPRDRMPRGTPRCATIVASDVILTTAPRDHIASPNVFEVRVAGFDKAGDGMIEATLTVGAARLFARLPMSEAGRLSLAPGQDLRAIVTRLTLW